MATWTPLPGIRRRTLSYGDATLMSEFRLQAGYPLPIHEHPQEQTGYLISARLRLTIGAETHDVAPGDSWSIPGVYATVRRCSKTPWRSKSSRHHARTTCPDSRVCPATLRVPGGCLESMRSGRIVMSERHLAITEETVH